MRECPFCHRLFEAELLSKEEIDSDDVTKQRDMPGPELVVGRGLIVDPETRDRTADPPKALITYKSTYRCKHCGKEWSKLSEEAVGIPKEYVADEKEKTDYDAEVETEEAREEEYAREESR